MSTFTFNNGFNLIGKDCTMIILDYVKDLEYAENTKKNKEKCHIPIIKRGMKEITYTIDEDSYAWKAYYPRELKPKIVHINIAPFSKYIDEGIVTTYWMPNSVRFYMITNNLEKFLYAFGYDWSDLNKDYCIRDLIEEQMKLVTIDETFQLQYDPEIDEKVEY